MYFKLFLFFEQFAKNGVNRIFTFIGFTCTISGARIVLDGVWMGKIQLLPHGILTISTSHVQRNSHIYHYWYIRMAMSYLLNQKLYLFYFSRFIFSDSTMLFRSCIFQIVCNVATSSSKSFGNFINLSMLFNFMCKRIN